jgi:hypothetical protein
MSMSALGGGLNRSPQHFILEGKMECGMERRFHRGFTAAEKTELWDRWKRGESLKAIGRAFGNQHRETPAQNESLRPVLVPGSNTWQGFELAGQCLVHVSAPPCAQRRLRRPRLCLPHRGGTIL